MTDSAVTEALEFARKATTAGGVDRISYLTSAAKHCSDVLERSRQTDRVIGELRNFRKNNLISASL